MRIFNATAVLFAVGLFTTTLTLFSIDKTSLVSTHQSNNSTEEAPPLADFNISGLVKTKGGNPIANVDLTIQADLPDYPFTVKTDANGRYGFERLPMMNQYRINVEPFGNPRLGINTLDIIIGQRHVLGIETFTNGYQGVSLDADGNESITSADLALLSEVLRGDPFVLADTDNWLFMTADTEEDDLVAPLDFSEISETSVFLTADTSTVDFTALKLGDLDGSVEYDVRGILREMTDTLVLLYEERCVNENEEFEIAFRSNDYQDIFGMQFTFATPGLEILAIVEDGDISVPSGLSSADELLYSKAAPLPENKDGYEVIFSLRVKAKESGMLSDILQLNNSLLAVEAYRANGSSTVDVEYLYVRLEVGSLVSFTDTSESLFFSLFQNVPNPTRGCTVIKYQVVNTGTAELYITDAAGRIVYTDRMNASPGINEFAVYTDMDLQSGMYAYTVRADGQQLSRSMLVVY